MPGIPPRDDIDHGHMNGDTQRLTIRRHDRRLALFGAPFLLVGLAVVVGGLSGAVPLAGGQSVVSIALYGGVFALAGAALVFGRSVLVLDRAGGVATSWWGLLVPFRSREHALDGFEAVTLAKEVRRSDKSTRIVYPVRLVGPGGTVSVQELRRDLDGRARAEQVARFLELPLRDSTSGEERVREHDTLDESLRDRARRMGEQPDPSAAPPPGTRTTLEMKGERLVITVPPLGLTPRHYFLMGVGLFAVFTTVPFLLIPFGMMGDSGGGQWVMAGVMAMSTAPAFVIGIGVAIDARRSERVTVSPEELIVERIGGFGRGVKKLAAGEIEELELAAAEVKPNVPKFMLREPRLVVVSDRLQIEVGRGLDPVELEWLRDVLTYVLSA